MTDLARNLLQLRLTVARYGEMDIMGWWNCNGLLGRTGRTLFSRGFPVTGALAQARTACTVAAARCQSLFAPPDCLTLWHLPAEVEDILDSAWLGWCRDTDSWRPFFERLEAIQGGDLLEVLRSLDLIDPSTEETARSLRRSAEGQAVPLPGTGRADSATIKLLAAGFSRGERQKPAVPYIRLSDA